jgi:UDP-N-acetylmuramyl tripeptide synthase
VIPDRKEAIRTALITAEKNDVILIAGKWDEHVMVTNKGHVKWHDKSVVNEILHDIDQHKVIT